MTATAVSITVGGSVTLTASQPGLVGGPGVFGAPVGRTETFTVGTTDLCDDVAVGTDGTATCTTSALPVGTDDVTATESGVAVTAFNAQDPVLPFEGTTEVFEVDVTAAAPSPTPTPTASASAAATATATPAPATVPAAGAGSPGAPPTAALLLVLGGGILIAASRRFRRAR
jgi:hypothetical protein